MNVGSDEQIFGEILNLLHDLRGAPKKKILENTTLGRDLGMDGDDAEEFMAAFKDRFKVDLTDFVFVKYFGVEAAFEPLSYLYLRIFCPEKLRKQEVTVADLMSAAKAGRWIKVE